MDTFTASYISDATREARAVATAAEARNREKYALLSRSHHFVPIAIETSGALGPDALSLLSEISRHQQSITHDNQSLSFLLQRGSIALKHGNATSVLGTTSSMQFIWCNPVYPVLFIYCNPGQWVLPYIKHGHHKKHVIYIVCIRYFLYSVTLYNTHV